VVLRNVSEETIVVTKRMLGLPEVIVTVAALRILLIEATLIVTLLET